MIEVVFSALEKKHDGDYSEIRCAFTQHNPNDTIVVTLDGNLLFSGEQSQFSLICSLNKHGFFEYVDQFIPPESRKTIGCFIRLEPIKSDTKRFMLFRSLCISYLFAEVQFRNRHSEIKDALTGQFIMDPTGAPGSQPNIYYVGSDVYSENDSDLHLKKLYELSLLNKMALKIDNSEDILYFKPFHTPTVRVDMIADTYPIWNKIRAAMKEEVLKIIDNQ